MTVAEIVTARRLPPKGQITSLINSKLGERAGQEAEGGNTLVGLTGKSRAFSPYKFT